MRRTHDRRRIEAPGAETAGGELWGQERHQRRGAVVRTEDRDAPIGPGLKQSGDLAGGRRIVAVLLLGHPLVKAKLTLTRSVGSVAAELSPAMAHRHQRAQLLGGGGRDMEEPGSGPIHHDAEIVPQGLSGVEQFLKERAGIDGDSVPMDSRERNRFKQSERLRREHRDPGQMRQVGWVRQPTDDPFDVRSHLEPAGAVEFEEADGAFEIANPVQQVNEVGPVSPGRRIELEVAGHHGWGPAFDPAESFDQLVAGGQFGRWSRH